MHLDVATLSVVTVFVTALLGTLLLFAGLQNRSIRAPLWWGAAYILGAMGLGLLAGRGKLPDFLSIDIANALMLLGYGLTWAGARVFDGRKLPPLIVVFAPILWLLACRIPLFANEINLRIVIGSSMLAMLALATAEELWRGRAEPLMSRWPAVIVLVVYSGALLARIPLVYFSPFTDNHALLAGSTFTLLAFGALLFTVVMAFLLLNMTKEASRSLCCCSISTASKRLTTVSVMPQAIGCCKPSPELRPRRSAPKSCLAVSAGKSSPHCCR
jgi:hypothetical protein